VKSRSVFPDSRPIAARTTGRAIRDAPRWRISTMSPPIPEFTYPPPFKRWAAITSLAVADAP